MQKKSSSTRRRPAAKPATGSRRRSTSSGRATRRPATRNSGSRNAGARKSPGTTILLLVIIAAAGIASYLYVQPPARQTVRQQAHEAAAFMRRWYREQFAAPTAGDGTPAVRTTDRTRPAQSTRPPAARTSPSKAAAPGVPTAVKTPSATDKISAPDPTAPPVTTLYRADEAFSGLLPVTIRRQNRPRDPAARARQLFTELTRDGAPGISPLPLGVAPQRFSFIGGTIIVDLPPDAPAAFAGGGSNDEMLAIYGLVNTLLKNMPAYDAVIFTIDGRRVPTLGGHLNLLEPLRFTEK